MPSDPAAPPPPPWHRLHLWEIQVVRDALLILAAWGLLHLGYVLSAVTVPMLIALGLAYLVEPLVRAVGRRYPRLTRNRVVGLILGGFVGAALVAVFLVVPAAVGQVGGLIRNAHGYLDGIERYAARSSLPRPLKEEIPDLVAGLRTLVPARSPAAETASAKETPPTALASPERSRPLSAGFLPLVADGRGLLGVVLDLIGGLVAFAFGAFLMAFFFVVFSTSWPAVLAFLRELVPPDRARLVQDLVGKMDQAVSGFVRGRLLISFFLAVFFGVGWTICGVPHALVLGLLTGMLTLVPYLSGVGAILACGLLAAASMEPGAAGFYVDQAAGLPIWWRVLLFPLLVYGLAQASDDWLLTPTIQGKATGMGPATIVVAVLAGGSLAGLYGMLLAIPTAACLRILVSDVLWPKVKAWVRGERADPLPFVDSR